ncbi:histidine phosphatase superfamily [Coprinopsis sp. MPI-PUGE-AT-0042]|nr:histidine phosphatase superfamily [Coprinopsis sp. MPI-PUGE-AT-0042]
MRPTALVVPGFLVATCVSAFPVLDLPEGQQKPLFVEPAAESSSRITNDIDVLKHLSAISPYFAPAASPVLPPTCKTTFASILVRHSSIMGNDDEWEMFMEPFVHKIRKLQKKHKLGKLHGEEWKFLRKWKTALNEKNLEKVPEQGEKDARDYGRYIRDTFGHLLPNGTKNLEEGDEKHNNSLPLKIWSASSDRDIVSAKNFILGAFPSNHTGREGEGDGEKVQLIEVPNNRKEWSGSLTPHKACDAFEKESSLIPAADWLHIYAPKVRKRLEGVIPKVAKTLKDEDVLAMQMTVTTGSSHFCNVFTDEEWLDFEYYNDIRYHYMMGYGNPLSPHLGMPWVKSAMHLLGGHHEGDWDEKEAEEGTLKKKDPKLPGPGAPPNATHTQHLHIFFTHRESPAFVATTLNLYNSTVSPESSIPASYPPPLSYRPTSRAWKTSHVVPFLGHITVERFHCTLPEEKDYVRVVVNGRKESMGGCDDGLDGSCEYHKFKTWVRERESVYGEWRERCEKP